MSDYSQILSNIKKKEYAPVYLLTGEEPYFIDKISKYIEENVLPDEAKGFNQMILYGRDVKADELISQCKRYPMMSTYQVIIVKEAQGMVRQFDQLKTYFDAPLESTILVLCYKHKSLDKRKSVYKSLKENAVIYESKKLYDNQIPERVKKMLRDEGYTLTEKAAYMVAESIGNNLSQIENELKKLMLVVSRKQQITEEQIETYIGISKDYNIFELRNAIGNKNFHKAFVIAHYFENNPKNNPLVVTLGSLHSFFVQLMQFHALPSKDPQKVAAKLKVNLFFVRQYEKAARLYSMKNITGILSLIKDFDLKRKGVGSYGVKEGILLKELISKMEVI